MRILITSGPTRAPLDAVRFISNRSTGRFGTLLAEEALRCRATVTLIHGRGSETPRPHPRLRRTPVETNRDLETALRRELSRRRYAAVVHAMAVLDFRPEKVRRAKVRSRRGGWRIRLIPERKVISRIRRWAPGAFLVGFKLEAGAGKDELIARGRRLLRESKADLVVANQLGEGTDRRHTGYLLDRFGHIERIVGKGPLARKIIKKALSERALSGSD